MTVLFSDTMGYYLQAFICKQADTNIFIDNFDKAKKVEIGQGLSLIPMTEDLFDQINNFAVSNSVDKFEYLTENIEAKILQLIGDKKIAYIEAEYFGGEGGQIAIIWENNKREKFLEYGQDKINEVLKDFGAIAEKGEDEFLTLGLDFADIQESGLKVQTKKANAQQKVLCNWGMTLKQSSAVHIQALYSADVILPGSSSKLRLLVINLASVPGGQLVNSPTAQSPAR
ncbi:MAG: hypothetical protein IPP96_17220 [Chitinophagaceae bacterium]|nr:hypothetical protein [Chitinophagaceae bacterium]